MDKNIFRDFDEFTMFHTKQVAFGILFVCLPVSSIDRRVAGWSAEMSEIAEMCLTTC
jgi:hypothetical protein